MKPLARWPPSKSTKPFSSLRIKAFPPSIRTRSMVGKLPIYMQDLLIYYYFQNSICSNLIGTSANLCSTVSPEGLKIFHHSIVFIDNLYISLFCECEPIVKSFGWWSIIPSFVLCHSLIERFALFRDHPSEFRLRFRHQFWNWMDNTFGSGGRRDGEVHDRAKKAY